MRNALYHIAPQMHFKNLGKPAPHTPDNSDSAQEAPANPEYTPPSTSETETAADTPVTYGNFQQDTLYELLSAEIAGQRNRFDLALDNYLRQARRTRDAGISERALRVAEFLGNEPIFTLGTFGILERQALS